MTETYWRECDDPEELLKYVWDRVSERKARLFACACCRSIWELLADWGRADLEAVERMADGGLDPAEFKSAGWFIPDQDTPAEYAVDYAVDLAARSGARDLELLAEVAHWAREARARPASGGEVAEEDDENDGGGEGVGDPYLRSDEMARQAHLARDLVPFHPAAVDPVWLTETVTALARAICAQRAFDQLPILADALQDAGCDNEDILDHCRGPGPHVRGCWVVDLVLGKE